WHHVAGAEVARFGLTAPACGMVATGVPAPTAPSTGWQDRWRPSPHAEPSSSRTGRSHRARAAHLPSLGAHVTIRLDGIEMVIAGERMVIIVAPGGAEGRE